MIPATFEYVRPATIDEAVDALAERGDEAKILAGGHSLLPLMKLRLAAPELVVDLGGIAELRGIRDDGDHLTIGAMTPHFEVVDSDLVRRHCGVLAEATAQVGDPQVRHRGTLGGALSHCDPAGDLPAVALAVDAEMVVRGPGGERVVPAGEFFTGYLEPAMAPNELLAEVRVPKLDGWGYRYEKFNRVAQAWAIVGACALVRADDGRVGEARVALTHMGPVPIRARATEQALAGASLDDGALADAAEAADEGSDPPTDLNARPDYRRHLARVLTRRALETAVGA